MGVTMCPPYCIVTELMDTSLFAVLHQEKRKLTPKQQLHISLGIARGLASLHAQPVPIVHRDIKSLNILVSNSGGGAGGGDFVVKICDLGKYGCGAGG
jgi:serine/threonine protein kinase